MPQSYEKLVGFSREMLYDRDTIEKAEGCRCSVRYIRWVWPALPDTRCRRNATSARACRPLSWSVCRTRRSRRRASASAPPMKNCGFRFPVSRIIVNLAPAGTKKSGTLYDLPILLGILLRVGAGAAAEGNAARFWASSACRAGCGRCRGVLPMALAAAGARLPGALRPRGQRARGDARRGPDRLRRGGCAAARARI